MWAVMPFLYSPIMPVSWRHLVPLAFAVGLLGSTVLSLIWLLGLWMLLGIVAAYTIVNLSASVQVVTRERDIRYLVVMPVIFTSLHLCYGLGSLWGLIKVVTYKIFRLDYDHNNAGQLC
jgi:hypothetical protein